MGSDKAVVKDSIKQQYIIFTCLPDDPCPNHFIKQALNIKQALSVKTASIIKKINTTLTPKLLTLALAIIFVAGRSEAAELDNPEQIFDHQIQYQQQKDALRQQSLTPNPKVSIQADDTGIIDKTDDADALTQDTIIPSDQKNTPCFIIHQIGYATPDQEAQQDLSRFDFALTPAIYGKHKLIGQCLDITRINKLVREVQNRLIQQGYTTTRVLVANQNLKSGILRLTLILGYIDHIQADTHASKRPIYRDDSTLPANFATALPLKAGEVLNIRALETGLENLKRVPSADANFSILPSHDSNQPGHSDVLIEYVQNRKLRLGVSVDDSGSKSTGKYQSNVTLSVDNPTYHNDLLYVSYGQNLGHAINHQTSAKKGSQDYALGYVLPIKRLLINPTVSHYDYHQTVAGVNQDYRYSGQSNNANLALSYLLYRDASSKTYLKAGGYYQSQSNDIDDTRVDVQRRRVAGWSTGLSYERYFGNTQLSGELGYQRGTGAFHALRPPEALFHEGSARTGIYKFAMHVNHPFNLKFKKHTQNIVYDVSIRGQYAKKALVPSDRLAIGGRYSVRGFDGERSLSGDRGLLLRQDLGFVMGQTAQMLYLGLDGGYVSMANHTQDNLLLGHHLVGAAIGIKGQIKPLHASYDVFAGHPLKQPVGFGGKSWISGFSLNFEF